MTPRRKAILAVLAMVAVAVLVVACVPVVHTVISGSFTIRYWQKSSQRIDRTTFEYTFQGEIQTTGPVETGVKAKISSADPSTTISDAFLMFPGAAPAAVTASFDTFTIRQARASAFSPAALAWTVTGMALPLDPGPANDATITGIDSDTDGIRDDLQRYNEFVNPHSARVRAAVDQKVRVLQDAIVDGGSGGQAHALGQRRMRSTECLDQMLQLSGLSLYDELRVLRQTGLEFERRAANTKDRADRYLVYSTALSGTVGDYQGAGSGGDCDFAPATLLD